MAQRTQSELNIRPDQPTRLRIGLIQSSPVFGTVEANIAQIRDLQAKLGPVDLAVTAELSVAGYGFTSIPESDQLAADDIRLDTLLSGPAGIGIGFAEQNTGGRPWNSYVVADPQTGSRLRQHKLHPVSYAPWNEHLAFQPGAALHNTEFRGVRTATIICNDMWHPSVPWLAVHRGAEVLIVPVASMEGRDGAAIRRTWQVILEHTSMLLQCYVVFVNRCGTDSGERFWGGSRVLGPSGNVLAALDDEPGTAVADLDLTALRRLRADRSILSEYRVDLLSYEFDSTPEPTTGVG